MGRVARMGEIRNAYEILVENPEGKRSLRRPRRRWEDNIRMYLHQAQDKDQWRAVVNTVEPSVLHKRRRTS